MNKLNENLKTAIEVRNVADQLIREKKLSSKQQLSWLTVFDNEELEQFIKEIDVFLFSEDRDNAEELKAIIHEWHESAIAINSSDLSQAFNDECDEVAFLTLQN